MATIPTMAPAISGLASSVELQARIASHRERRTAALYAMSRELSATRGEENILRAAVKHLHEALSLTGLAAILGHGLLLLGDGYLRPGLAGIALPFAMNHRPLWTGIGIIGV